MSNYDKNVGFVEGENRTSEDTIHLGIKETDGTQVTISLIADSKITWWKGVNSGQWEMLSTQDDRIGPNIGNYPLHYLQHDNGKPKAKLSKAKAFGVHTEMYDLMVKGGFKQGYHYTFKWLKDS